MLSPTRHPPETGRARAPAVGREHFSRNGDDMKIVQKLAIVVTTGAMLAIGLLGSPAQAADSSWGCGGCVIVKR